MVENSAAVAEPGREVAEHRRGVGRREEQQRREVEQVVDPEAPAAQRAGERPEGAVDPGVDAALLGILLRQDRDGEGQRHEERQPRQHPQQHRRRPGAGAARNPAQAGDGDDGEEDDVPEAEDPLQLRLLADRPRAGSSGGLFDVVLEGGQRARPAGRPSARSSGATARCRRRRSGARAGASWSPRADGWHSRAAPSVRPAPRPAAASARPPPGTRDRAGSRRPCRGARRRAARRPRRRTGSAATRWRRRRGCAAWSPSAAPATTA